MKRNFVPLHVKANMIPSKQSLLPMFALLLLSFLVPVDSVFGLQAARTILPNAAITRTNWVASASSSAPNDTPEKAIDGNSASRWSTGALQTPGQFFQIDFGASYTFDRIVMDSGGAIYEDDYPRGYEVYVSPDGATWNSPVASGTGSGSITTITFAAQTARYMMIVQTGSDSVRWWSIHEINVYEPAGSGAPGWRQITSAGPVARALHTAAFDPRRRQAIIFGGVQEGFQTLGDLWAFSMSSETWQEIIVSGDRPTPRWAPAAITDEARDRMVLFFGLDDSGSQQASNEIWALNFETRQWTRLASGPTGRFDAAAATDGTRAWTHGGFTGFPLTPDKTLDDLWEFNLQTNTWRQLPNNGTAPPPTTNAALAYHQGALYLVGGHDAVTITPGTWRYDLASERWEQLSQTGAPAAWAHHGRATDESCGTFLLMGGDNDDERDVPFLEALQMGSNSQYIRLPGEIPEVSRHHTAMALDPSTRQLVMFGGFQGDHIYLGDTWIYTLGSCPTSTPTPTPSATPTPTPTPIPSELPSPWVSSDLGSVGLAGRATEASGTFIVTAAGADIWGTSDGFHFVYQPLSGDGQIVARVASLQNTHPNAKAGVMIRETLSATSRHALMNVTPAVGQEFLRRLSDGGVTSLSGGGSVAAPYWVKVERNGNTISGYSSSDGVSWEFVGSDTIQMGANVLIGLAVTSHNNSVLTTATFDNVSVTSGSSSSYKVLVFSKTLDFRHDSIPSAVAAITNLGAQNNFTVDATEDSAVFTDTNLAQYRAVIFLLTTGDVLDESQQAALERYIRSGNGYVGVHSASDTEYYWPWYGELVGAYFAGHPEIQTATVRLEDRTHPSTSTLPDPWTRTDEWYNFQTNPRGKVQVLATLDETTYSGGTMGDHPIAWYRAYDGGRSWYTAGGHTTESYSEPLFLEHLLGGIKYSAGVATAP